MGLPDQIANLTGPPPGAPASIPIGGGGPGAGPAGPPPDLGGGGGGPAGLPPELAAALAGGPGGPGASPAGPDQGDGLPDNSVDLMRGAVDHLSKYLDVEQDDIDKAVVAKALAQLQAVFAKDQKEQEAAQGTTPAMRGMVKGIQR